MKTTAQIESEIQEIKGWHNDPEYYETAEYKKAGRKVTLLQSYIYYLQAGAQEKFLQKDLEVLENRLDIIDKGFGKWLKWNKENDQLKNPQAKYNSEMGTRKVKRQIKALKYLLN